MLEIANNILEIPNDILEIPNIIFAQRAWDKMRATARNCGDAETGGLLLGRLRQSKARRELLIARVSGPGPCAQRTSASFRPDIDHYSRVLRNTSDLIYCGEWHSHPAGNPAFSERDLLQAQQIVDSEGVGEIICPICMRNEHGAIQVRCFYFRSGMSYALPIAYTIAEKSNAKTLSRLIIENRVLRSFLNSHCPIRTVKADFYPQNGTAHVFAKALRGDAQAVLINSDICQELNMDAQSTLAIAVTPKKQGKYDAHGYDVSGKTERALITEVVSLRHDQLQRNRSLLESSALRGKRVAIVGLGSIGGAAALELARTGVDKFTLIDPDRLSIANLCRHICDLSDLGALKVDAVSARITRIMPYARVRCLPIDINASPKKALNILRDADIILASTDTESSRLLINWVAHQTKTIAIFAGLLERAIVGRVWRVLPQNGACYQCHPSTEDLKQRTPVAYSAVKSERDITVEPGLGNDIAFITQLAVRYAIDTLRMHKGKSELPYHMVFWFNHAREGAAPLTLYRVEEIPPRKNCPICGNSMQKLSTVCEKRSDS